MKIIYIADDGKEFNDEIACAYYEWILKHPALREVKVYNKDNEELFDLLEQNTYEYAQKIIVPTDVAARQLQDLADFTGYCYYEQIVEKGIWEFKQDVESFVKVDGIK